MEDLVPICQLEDNVLYRGNLELPIRLIIIRTKILLYPIPLYLIPLYLIPIFPIPSDHGISAKIISITFVPVGPVFIKSPSCEKR